MALPRALLVLLFLNLSLLGGHASPTGSPDGNSGPSAELELLDNLHKSVSSLQEDPVTPEPLSNHAADGEAREPAAIEVLRAVRQEPSPHPEICLEQNDNGLGCKKVGSS